MDGEARLPVLPADNPPGMEPDANCITTADGGCIGGAMIGKSCMHDAPVSVGLPVDAKERKALPLWTYMVEYFPDSFIEEVRVAKTGNDQHNPGQPMHWARAKSPDQMDCAFRHMLDHSRGNVRDADGCFHLAKAIWRLKAELQLTIERERNATQA